MDLGEWLRSLGLERYEGAFRDNAIDETVLSDLTDQDLEKLGVLLGHRRERAIASDVPGWRPCKRANLWLCVTAPDCCSALGRYISNIAMSCLFSVDAAKGSPPSVPPHGTARGAGRCRSLGWPFFEEGRSGRLQLSHCSGLNPKEPEVPRKPERQSAEDRRAIRPGLGPRITRKIKRLHGKNNNARP
jgi:SAM domain (Sterile alpha motif)